MCALHGLCAVADREGRGGDRCGRASRAKRVGGKDLKIVQGFTYRSSANRTNRRNALKYMLLIKSETL